MEHKQIIGLLVHNHPGVLLRVTSLFTRRGFNIDSLTVSPAGIDGYSRMTIRINGDDAQAEQFINQMMKIVASELILIKISTQNRSENDILSITSSYHASVVNIGENSITFRASGTPEKIDELVEEVSPFGILEMARTGIASLEKGDKCLNS